MPNPRPDPSQEQALERVASLAKLMDSQFRIPGTDLRFGLESVVGLLPVGGDAVGFLASAGLVLTMARHGASPQLVARMLINVAVDAFVGAIPLLGDLFDIVYKANNRNVRLLEAYYAEGKYRGSAWPVVSMALVGPDPYWGGAGVAALPDRGVDRGCARVRRFVSSSAGRLRYPPGCPVRLLPSRAPGFAIFAVRPAPPRRRTRSPRRPGRGTADRPPKID